jgi:hypothetical protein
MQTDGRSNRELDHVLGKLQSTAIGDLDYTDNEEEPEWLGCVFFISQISTGLALIVISWLGGC